jgi:phage regulator Rha-like protein
LPALPDQPENHLAAKLVASVEQIESRIFVIRGQKVMLDADLAELYGVETKALNRAVKRNFERFPEDCMFQLTAEEFADLRCQFGTSNIPSGRGGRRHLPYAFTEHGAIMAASVLNSPRAVETSVQFVRAFVRLRQILASNAELSRKLATLEKKYDIQFKAVFDAIRQLMTPLDPKKNRPIGFAPWKEK